MKIKTIDVNAKEWFDKVNGNSYFAGTVTINYGLKTEKTFKMPFQYGYGDQSRYSAFDLLKKNKVIKMPENTSIWQFCESNKIVERYNLQTNCLKRELMYYNE
jgi:hypothetical protein